MATSALDNNRENITLLKEIQIRNFAQDSAVPNSAIFFYNDTEPFCEVFVNPVCRSNPEFVSVRVRRCSFYPRFFPGVIYPSLGWSVSVVDDEGVEKFGSYFGYEDFQSMDWVEDFFSERGYELEKFVERSVLLEDPERLLPGGVLTVRVETFYECQFGDQAVILKTYEDDLEEFLSKPFPKRQGALAKKKQENLQTDSILFNADESEKKNADSNGEDSEKSTKLFLQGKNFHEKVGYWKKESVLMMEETIHELKRAFELYGCFKELEHKAKLRHVRIYSIANYSLDDYTQEMNLFQRLFTEVGLGPPIEWDFSSWMKVPFGVDRFSDQRAWFLGVNKHLQNHWKNCEEVYKRAAEKRLISEDDDGKNSEKPKLEDGIRELFFIYKETVKENNRSEKPNHLLKYVSRFLKVFSVLTIVLSLDIFKATCVHTNPQQSSVAQKEEDENEDRSSITATSITGEDDESVEEASLTVKSPLVVEESEPSGIWYFTIETCDQERFQIPFQTGTSTTLGSLIRSASPVFDRMLETPMSEKSNRLLKMEDFDSSTFFHFLSYLGSGKVNVDTMQECLDLYQLAHKYLIEQLVLDCRKKMEKMMDDDDSSVNAEQVLEFSRFYRDHELMWAIDDLRMIHRSTLDFFGLIDDFSSMVPLVLEPFWPFLVKEIPSLENINEESLMESMPLKQIEKEKYDFYK